MVEGSRFSTMNDWGPSDKSEQSAQASIESGESVETKFFPVTQDWQVVATGVVALGSAEAEEARPPPSQREKVWKLKPGVTFLPPVRGRRNQRGNR